MNKKVLIISNEHDGCCYGDYYCGGNIKVEQAETIDALVDVIYENYGVEGLFDRLCKKIPNFDKQMKHAGYVNKKKIRKLADKLEFDKEYFGREGSRVTLSPFEFDSISDYLVDKMADEKLEIFQRVNLDATLKKLLPKDKLERYKKRKASKAKRVKAAAERRKKKAEEKKLKEIEEAKKLLKHHGVEIK